MKQNTVKLLEIIGKIAAVPPVIIEGEDAEKLRVDAHRAAKHLERTIVTRKVSPTTLHIWVTS